MRANPKPEFVIDKLARQDDLSEFDCGKPTLSQWLRKCAWANQQADSARTYVALDGRRVAGFYALTTGSVHKHASPRRIAEGLANHPTGIVLRARLAVDQSQQGKGLGKALLFDALSRIAEAADVVAVRAVMVHAIDDAARRFYRRFGFEESPVDPYQLLLPLKARLWFESYLGSQISKPQAGFELGPAHHIRRLWVTRLNDCNGFTSYFVPTSGWPTIWCWA